MSILSIRLTDQLHSRLSEEARLVRQPKSLIARNALEQFLADKRRERFLARMTSAAKAIDPEHAAAVAEEALPFDNEAVALTENLDESRNDG